jgi:signal transduction histidine kinase
MLYRTVRGADPWSVDEARSHEAGGTGLGLLIVKHVIEPVQGTVSVEKASCPP